MKGSSRTIFIMVTGGSFIQMEIITLGIGLMGSGLGTGGLSISPAGYTKGNGSIVNLWENDEPSLNSNSKIYAI